MNDIHRYVKRAKVDTIYRTTREDKLSVNVMRGDPNGADSLGGGALTLNLPPGHGLEPGDVLLLTVEKIGNAR